MSSVSSDVMAEASSDAGVEYLLEIRAADLPPESARRVLEALAGTLFEELMGLGLGPRGVVTGWTPRRLLVALEGLPPTEPTREETLLGPPESEAYGPKGGPNAKLRGFAKRVGVAVRDLRPIRTEKGTYLGLVRQARARSIQEVLSQILPRLLANLPWEGESMRWLESERRGGGGNAAAWGRPVRGLLSLLGGKLLPLELCGVAAGVETRGHPLHSPELFEVSSLAEYRRRLAARDIEISFERRRAILAEKLERWAGAGQRGLSGGAGLLDRLAGRSEIPNLLTGHLGSAARDLPREVAEATMRTHLEAFVSWPAEGGGEASFATVLDQKNEAGEAMVRRHEAAVEGYLLDVAHHLSADRLLPLATRRSRLQEISFHSHLGSYGAKAGRLAALARVLAEELGWKEEADATEEAASLAKADLAAASVRHMPRLQGILGGLLAQEEGYGETVWKAIQEHYLPRRPHDPLPSGKVGKVLSLADRLDTLVGYFAIGNAPSGSRDPSGLRRLAQGLVRLLIETPMDLDLDLIAARALLLYSSGEDQEGKEKVVFTRPPDAILTELRSFLLGRARTQLGQMGFAFDEIEAALAAGAATLPELTARVDALATVRREEGFAALIQASKRIDKILAEAPEHPLTPELLEEPAERALGEEVSVAREAVLGHLSEGNPEDALRRMIPLAPLLETFFTEVLVMDEDPARRANRLALLQSTRRVFWRAARLKELDPEPDPEPGGF